MTQGIQRILEHKAHCQTRLQTFGKWFGSKEVWLLWTWPVWLKTGKLFVTATGQRKDLNFIISTKYVPVQIDVFLLSKIVVWMKNLIGILLNYTGSPGQWAYLVWWVLGAQLLSEEFENWGNTNSHTIPLFGLAGKRNPTKYQGSIGIQKVLKKYTYH